ncbi:hypothetical protein [Lapillicoccus sp.]|uniref:hypothetical protein n=1 Tax=Lapillicoccus sp. TaxID=1909287 RepID=UPI0032634F7F
MTTSAAGVAGLVRVVDGVRRSAAAVAEDVLGHLPDTGDHVTGRSVDDFVEQAADALRALETLALETLRVAGAAPAPDAAGNSPTPPSSASSTAHTRRVR